MKSVYDVIIVGSGISGLYTALNIEEKKVLLVTKSNLSSGNSPLAQGGIVSCLSKNIHFLDTIKAGSFYNRESAVIALEEDCRENIEKLIDIGTDFEKDQKGRYKYTKEGGHTINTILYSKDKTGKEISNKLIAAVKEKSNIDFAESTFVTSIVQGTQKDFKVSLLNDLGEVFQINSHSVVLATGGIGEVYLNSTNSKESTGDGVALAYNLGAKIVDMEFIQFHPTSFYMKKNKRRVLISESLRGEGARLVNDLGEYFMEEYHPMKELAPRDVVSRGIYKEISQGRKVYLDMTDQTEEYLKERFPTVYDNCAMEDLNLSKDLIEVSPAEHYIMGGIETDLNGNTSIRGLYACGECACTGAHGANRLASNSLLEALVFSKRIAKKLNKTETSIAHRETAKVLRKTSELDSLERNKIKDIREELKKVMEYNLGIVRTEDKIKKALKMIDSLESELSLHKIDDKIYYEALNMIIVSRLISISALNRKESLGAHYIEKGEKVC